MTTSIDIVDIGSGNVRSIKNSLSSLNLPSKSVSKPEDFSSDILILPGVGSAGLYMQKIRASGLDEAIIEHALSGKRLIGICLGYQLMSDYSEEDGGVEGLGLIKGRTEKLRHEGNSLTHNGWQEFLFRKKMLADSAYLTIHNLSRKQKIEGRVFFNHEYGVICNDENVATISIKDDILSPYAAMVVKKNIIGMQFHPEKSQITGLDLMAMLL
jgi:glutamine amidotransferase